MKKLLVLVTVILFCCTTVGPLWGEEAEMVNINTASAGELEKLYRVGPAYAVRIIEYREENGPFEKPEDIMKVHGIGPKTFERNKDRITVELPE
jgi:competence protein ComEA